MNGITVSVDYADLLAITLPRNAKHFGKVLVVTTEGDGDTLSVVAGIPNAEVFVTDAFYRDGADFNKGLAIEEGLDVLGREGWLCSFDADILIPKTWPTPPVIRGRTETLYAPHRRIVSGDLLRSLVLARELEALGLSRGESCDWVSAIEKVLHKKAPRYNEPWEFAGAFLLWHASAPHLQGKRPWFGTNWRHAGGYDSDFYFAWPEDKRYRLPWDVLHIGDHGQNWFGRQTKYLDGTDPVGAAERRAKMENLAPQREREGYRPEKLP